MILLIDKSIKIDFAAVQALSKLRSNEEIGSYLETNLSTITDDSLTFVDLSGNADFQNSYHPEPFVKKLMECGLSPSIKTINFIVSDVDITQSMRAYGYQVAYEFLKHGREMSTYVSSDERFIQTCIVPPMDEDETWKIYAYNYDNLRTKIVKPYTGFTYEDFIKLPECKIIWEGKNFDEWLKNSYRLTDNRTQYAKKVDFASITPVPITVNKGSISNHVLRAHGLIDNEADINTNSEDNQKSSKINDTIPIAEQTLSAHKNVLFPTSKAVKEKGNAAQRIPSEVDEQKEKPSTFKKQKT